jgi:hypothetical protein
MGIKCAFCRHSPHLRERPCWLFSLCPFLRGTQRPSTEVSHDRDNELVGDAVSGKHHAHTQAQHCPIEVHTNHICEILLFYFIVVLGRGAL